MLIRETDTREENPWSQGGHGAVCSAHRERPGISGITGREDEVGVWCWGLGMGTLSVWSARIRVRGRRAAAGVLEV